MSNAVECRKVSFCYDGTDKMILNEADFILPYGEFAVLSGISGEGKTTLLSIINGVIPFLTQGKLTGQIFLDGEDCTTRKVSERAKLVGTVLQNADEQIVYEKALDEAAFGCENLNLPSDAIEHRALAALELMKIAPNASTKTLSGGQKQRLITAATLAMGQKILILDEPLANLDRQGSLLLLETLRKLTRQGYAVLLIEHRLDVVLPYADTVYQLTDGKVVRAKDTERLLTENRIHLSYDPPQNRSREPLLTLSGVRYAPGKQPVLKGVDLQLSRGEKLILLGENGCGKTTLLRLLARIVRPDAGRYAQNLIKQRRKNRPSAVWFQKAGYVYQNPSYQLFMPTVLQEITCSAVSEGYARRMLSLFGLSGLEERHPHSLSEGQKRRLGLAAVLAAKPELLFLDEPTVGQDVGHLTAMVEALHTLQRETGMTMVTVTHDIRCVAALCDRALFLQNGVIAAEGDAQTAEAYLSGKFAI